MALWGLTRNSLEGREKCKNGVKGIHPLGFLPLWGKERVTFVFFFNKKMNKIRFSPEPTNVFFNK
jgi:hypothetical protein